MKTKILFGIGSVRKWEVEWNDFEMD